MKRYGWILGLLWASGVFAEAPMLPVIDRDGVPCVSAAHLERTGGIAIKRLPGQKQVVACSGERCVVLKDFIDETDDVLVRIESLARALGAKPRFDEARRNVNFEFLSNSLPASPTARVGQLAPDFRLRKLDGSPVALSDFRGKRVLINSWASW